MTSNGRLGAAAMAVSGGVRLLPSTGASARPSTEICATVASGPPVIATIVSLERQSAATACVMSDGRTRRTLRTATSPSMLRATAPV